MLEKIKIESLTAPLRLRWPNIWEKWKLRIFYKCYVELSYCNIRMAFFSPFLTMYWYPKNSKYLISYIQSKKKCECKKGFCIHCGLYNNCECTYDKRRRKRKRLSRRGIYADCEHSASSVEAEVLPDRKLSQFELLLDVFNKTKEKFKNIPSIIFLKEKKERIPNFITLEKKNRCDY